MTPQRIRNFSDWILFLDNLRSDFVFQCVSLWYWNLFKFHKTLSVILQLSRRLREIFVNLLYKGSLLYFWIKGKKWISIIEMKNWMNIFLFQSSYLISLENYKLKMTSGLDGTPSFLLKDFDLGKAIDIYFQNVSVNAVFVPRGWRVKFQKRWENPSRELQTYLHFRRLVKFLQWCCMRFHCMYMSSVKLLMVSMVFSG